MQVVNLYLRMSIHKIRSLSKSKIVRNESEKLFYGFHGDRETGES